ncbi:MAG: hypothetical protein A3C85_04150 [Candidatus Doudnabacteria bacterium RIFCSPHIGHO2_02_FULL_48_21]|uniref:DUF218 domain-containing protein n=1 Tax=Candidatus Doudnabacteria bacterium RIFCSPLOWO2_02_FULL_48_13 TaxID=1817845 RepID=A0A1F5QA80_9BACT|nr:MAG: hypothetical protein A3K05_00835 [Candidatus Doudnabacteria bacterium RIFCSPHIGHO2_01_48_18]OGE78854.1 MAG: hypothetical protein A2668_00550 [Candidatus Doudnabacteria bacterium RIFCSPHIGHO2_01_FULL_48_180]OGE91845.1 MAG: hypothetical protein A3F44_04230 [Candidatus Doudnabacteria bacterium RIFCSPHIGHO2_12_FULL_47_25]OGE94082.1 MAG: hypothetical protein A3C85_04150 [Candidatus Doudnabacteria bacterium RIFCSPHIGHO2_02_FULL_48_21]OGE98212.1 MAG: hypothetical protein A3A83_03525 [Candidatu
MERIAIVDIACGSVSDGVTCQTSDMRDREAVRAAREALESTKIPPLIIVTGSVPRTPGGVTLAQLKKRNVEKLLAEQGLQKIPVFIAEQGYDSFSEARSITSLLRLSDFTAFTLVSSHWYMPYGGEIWQRRAEENKLCMTAWSVVTPTGAKTRKIYRRNSRILKAAIVLRMEPLLEFFVGLQTSRRKTKGFTWTGCD